VRFAQVRDLSVPLDLHFVYRSDNRNPALRVFIDGLQTCLASRPLPTVIDIAEIPKRAMLPMHRFCKKRVLDGIASHWIK
jgi:hypothetical protein